MSWPTTGTAFSKLTPTDTITYAAGSPFFSVRLTDSKSNAYQYYPTGAVAGTADRHSLGYLNSTVDYPYSTVSGPTYGTYLGEPYKNPFPWLTWNNRPFTSPME